MYAKLKGISDRLIKQFGQPCTVMITEAGKYNPATGERKKGNITVNHGYCLFDNLAFDFRNHQSPSVQQGDVMIYLTESGKPVPNAVIEASSERWSVINVQPLNPAGTTLIYQVQGRKLNG